MYGFKDTPKIIREVYLKDKGVLERTFSNGKVYHVYMEGIQTIKIEEVTLPNLLLKGKDIGIKNDS